MWILLLILMGAQSEPQQKTRGEYPPIVTSLQQSWHEMEGRVMDKKESLRARIKELSSRILTQKSKILNATESIETLKAEQEKLWLAVSNIE
jgi:hypothetical protein